MDQVYHPSALERLLGVDGDASPGDTATDPYLVGISRRAMACQFQVFLNAGQYPEGSQAAIAALDLVDQLEAQLTIYRSDSEVAEVNRNAADGPVTVERRLFELLEQSVELWRATDGTFDITAGPLSEAWGFARRDGHVPTAEQLAAALEQVGSQSLRLDSAERTIEFDRLGMMLNLGAIGKGHALDRAAGVLEDRGMADFLFHGGQSSVLARGNRGGPGGTGWSVGLLHPLRPDRRIGEFRLVDRALSTSGSGTQFFVHQGRRYGHILDPRSGQPAGGMLSATVLASTAAEADALSTALYVMGPERAAQWCAEHPEISALLVWPGRKTGTVEIAASQLGQDDWTPQLI